MILRIFPPIFESAIIFIANTIIQDEGQAMGKTLLLSGIDDVEKKPLQLFLTAQAAQASSHIFFQDDIDALENERTSSWQ